MFTVTHVGFVIIVAHCNKAAAIGSNSANVSNDLRFGIIYAISYDILLTVFNIIIISLF